MNIGNIVKLNGVQSIKDELDRLNIKSPRILRKIRNSILTTIELLQHGIRFEDSKDKIRIIQGITELREAVKRIDELLVLPEYNVRYFAFGDKSE